MDINRYGRLKLEGVADVLQTDEGIWLRFKRFNPETGKELDDAELQLVTVEQIKKRRETLTSEVDIIDSLLAELHEI